VEMTFASSDQAATAKLPRVIPRPVRPAGWHSVNRVRRPFRAFSYRLWLLLRGEENSHEVGWISKVADFVHSGRKRQCVLSLGGVGSESLAFLASSLVLPVSKRTFEVFPPPPCVELVRILARPS
jgi:hypothetical protein